MATSKQPRVWVLIADGEHARVVTPKESNGHFETVIAFDSASAHLRSADLGTDKPGRTFESASITRHAIAPRSDPHRNAKHHFIQDVAALVDQHDQKYEFDRLVLVAPAHALSDLREALGKSAAAKVVGSVAKDLVKVNDHDLTAHLADWWLAPPASAE